MPPEKKLGRAHEDQIKPRTSELFDSETLEQFNVHNIWNWRLLLRIGYCDHGMTFT